MNNQICRIAVFYDGSYTNKINNFYHYNHERQAHLNFIGLHDFIAEKVAECEGIDKSRCRIIDSNFFRGRLNAVQAKSDDKLFVDRAFEDGLLRANITLNHRHIRTHDGMYVEKGIDVWLALEAYETTVQKHIDVCVLVAGDGDFSPLVDKINALGARVMLLAWNVASTSGGETRSTSTSKELMKRSNYCMEMDVLINEAHEDDEIINNIFLPSRDINLRTEGAHLGTCSDIPQSKTSYTGHGRSRNQRPGGESGYFQRENSAQNKRNESPNTPFNDGELKRGSIMSYFPEKKYGFITPDDGSENIFFHVTSVQAREDEINIDASVEYRQTATDRGRAAVDIHFLPEHADQA